MNKQINKCIVIYNILEYNRIYIYMCVWCVCVWFIVSICVCVCAWNKVLIFAVPDTSHLS